MRKFILQVVLLAVVFCTAIILHAGTGRTCTPKLEKLVKEKRSLPVEHGMMPGVLVI